MIKIFENYTNNIFSSSMKLSDDNARIKLKHVNLEDFSIFSYNFSVYP